MSVEAAPGTLSGPGSGEAAAATTGARLGSLDGIRALAVLAVLFFHGEMSWATGGFLGVSVFFTLSGYLITSLLLSEHSRTERIDLKTFWSRRFRRLAPASLLLLAAVLAAGVMTGITQAVIDGVRASALYVYNWFALASGSEYSDIFSAPSPVEHFWSLAIEEQFYLFFPLLGFAFLRGRGAAAKRNFAIVLVVLWTASVASNFVWTDPNRIYLGTDTRAAELLTGALLAMLFPLVRQRMRTAGTTSTLVGAGAIAVIGYAVWQTSLADSWLYQGGLPAFSLISAALIFTASQKGPLSTALAWRPLKRLGEISYGVYLFHWPIFLLLDQEVLDIPLGALLVVRIAVTLVLADLSYRLLEAPIRTQRLLSPAAFRTAFAGSMAALMIWTVAIPTSTDDTVELASILSGSDGEPELGLVSPELPPSDVAGATTVRPVVPDQTPTPEPTAPAPPLIALAGDSIPKVLANEIGDLGPAEFGTQILNLGIEGCDGARGASELRYYNYREFQEHDFCTRWQETWPNVLDANPPSAVVFMLGAAAGLDRNLDGRWTDPCQGDFRDWYTSETLARLDWTVNQTDAEVFLATVPWADRSTFGIPRDHQDRSDCLNWVYESVLAQRPDVHRLDVRGFVCPGGRDGCNDLRSDGLHYRDDGAAALARWMIPEVMAATEASRPIPSTDPVGGSRGAARPGD